jgi:uncharacterized protein (DUF1501 family)
MAQLWRFMSTRPSMVRDLTWGETCGRRPSYRRSGPNKIIKALHEDCGATNGRLAALLGALDGAVNALESGLGESWHDTVVAVVTEFGRTARINGTEGTDHGTATVSLLVGGALKGGRVIADWPGLKETNLYDGRDLKPTTDLRGVMKGILKDHLRGEERALAQDVFPGSQTVKPLVGLVT